MHNGKGLSEFLVKVTKENELLKAMTITKAFTWENDEKNIVNHVKDFYQRNCYGSFLDDILHKNISMTARETYHALHEVSGDGNNNASSGSASSGSANSGSASSGSGSASVNKFYLPKL